MKRSDAVRMRCLSLCLLTLMLALSVLPVFAEETPSVPLWQPLGDFAAPPNPMDYLIPTPQSSCFSRYGYVLDNGLLFLEFRESGSLYVYYGIDFRVWDDFSRASSLGGYYNDFIKGFYTCSRVW